MFNALGCKHGWTRPKDEASRCLGAILYSFVVDLFAASVVHAVDAVGVVSVVAAVLLTGSGELEKSGVVGIAGGTFTIRPKYY